MQSNYFVWNINPVAFDLGTIHLPFPIAIWGLVAAFIFMYLGYEKLVPDDLPANKEPDIEAWKTWGLIIGSLVLGQLIFAVLPSPKITQIGPIEPRWYGFLFASSFIVGFWLTRRMFEHANRPVEEVDQLLTYMIIATVIGARLGHVIFYDLMYYLRHPFEIIAIWHGGLASHGAAIGIIIAMYLFAKKRKDMSFLWLADRVVIVVAIAGAFIRMGNFCNSEIVGKPTDVPWAIIFPRARVPHPGLPRHPSMLYEAILCILAFAILWYIYKKYKNSPPEGSLFGTFMIFVFGGRFFLEFFKEQQAHFATGILNMGQWLSIPLVIAGLWLLIKKVDWSKPSPVKTKASET
ncbi:MAG TPA: prolipoprotein diacylglyceryl transferase [Balneolaceae bacterium]|nr:prolipoprotein diacylglyceryl transferase [Balneolaceae bacterium]